MTPSEHTHPTAADTTTAGETSSTDALATSLVEEVSIDGMCGVY